MLAAAERSYVAAQSGGGVAIGGPQGDSGFGNGGFDGTPNPRRGFEDITR